MVKSITKRYKILVIISTATVLLLSSAYFLLRSPAVQAFLINRISISLGEKTQFPISVGSVRFTFFHRLRANDILVLDHNNDTLIFVSRVTVGIKRISPGNRIIHLARIIAHDPVMKIITDSAGINNLNLFLERISKQPESEAAEKNQFIINQIEIANGHFALKNSNVSTHPPKEKVDFSNLSLNSIYALIEDFRILNDSVSMTVHRASFFEKSGFMTERFSGLLSISKNEIKVGNVELKTENSNIAAEVISLSYSNSEAFKDFTNEVRIQMILDSSVVSSSDLFCFLPATNANYGEVTISGSISGTVSQLKGRNIKINGGTLTRLECNFDFSGLPDIDNTFLFIDVRKFITRLSEIGEFGIAGKEKLPADIDKETGIVNFTGTFAGFTTDFVTYGKLITESGELSTDLSFRPSGKNEFKFRGTMQGTGIEAGKLMGQGDLLGEVDFHLNIIGESRSINDFDGTVEGAIEKAVINNYTYSDIKLNGSFTEKGWDGSIIISDKNLNMSFNGVLDFSHDIPQYNFALSIPHSHPDNLNIDKAGSVTSANLEITANFQGNTIDNITGKVFLLNSKISSHQKTLEINNGSIEIGNCDEGRFLMLNSDFADISLKGSYDFGTIAHSCRTLLAGLLPSYFDPPATIIESVPNRFTLSTEFKETKKLSEFFDLGINIGHDSRLLMEYNQNNETRVNATLDYISVKNNILNKVMVDAFIKDSSSTISVSGNSLRIAGETEMINPEIHLITHPDTIELTMVWDNKKEILNNGSISLLAMFSKEDSIKRTYISILPSDVRIRGNKWTINPARLILGKKHIITDNLLINSEKDYFRVNGTMSERKTDTLSLAFDGLNLGSLNYMTGKSDENKLNISLEGILSGRVLITGLFAEPMLETDGVVIENFRMMDHDYGFVYLNSSWDNNRKVADINLFNQYGNMRALDVSGFYNPEEKQLELKILTNKLPVDILNNFLASFASGIKGYASGIVRLTGKISQPVLTGALFVSEGGIKIDYLQTQYYFNDSIRFDKKGILFNNIVVADDKGNKARLNGVVKHKYFNDFQADLTILPAQTKVLDTRPKDNDIFYGTAYATGVVTIKTSDDLLLFEISAKTERNTRFIIPFTSSQSIGDYSFISFTGPHKQSENDTDIAEVQDKVKPTTVSLNFDLDVTPDAEVQLVLDAKAGDVMSGRGSGKLNVSLTPKGDFYISGDYVISTGEYLFTLGNIFNKKFSVDEGSRLSWNGSLTNADIDITARYRLETSLYDLILDERFRKRMPVECILHMTGVLVNPSIAFDITLPTADEQTRSYLRNTINTDEELLRQFAYLLMMGTFYPDPAYRAGNETLLSTGAGMSAIGNTMEMFSNQLSNWLSQISNDFDLGFVYRPGNEISAQEVEMAFSTQLINDKITINGNFDVGAGQKATTATTISGEFDVGVSITQKLKFKFFNRSNDNVFYETAPYTQGIGLFFRHDFDRFTDLFRRKNADKVKKRKNASQPATEKTTPGN